MRPLKIGISGVRGVVGDTLTPELLVGFAQAFGTYLDSGRILVCRDTRPSGPMVAASVFAGLLASGCEVVDLGVCPTPTMQLSVTAAGAQGGVSITAGHNSAQWNALKFVRADGLYLNASQADELLDVFHQGEYVKAEWRQIPTGIGRDDAIRRHVEVLLSRFDVAAIRSRRFKIAVDCCNGACSRLTPPLLGALGCEVWAINDDPAMPFPHTPEPRAETMAQVAALVRAGKADIGFAHDSDGERLGIVDETGRCLSEEMTLPLAAEIVLSAGSPGPVVTNLSTTSTVDLVADRHGARVVRTPVGQSYVSEAMVENGASVGGEGNGSVAISAIHATHDSAAAIVLILEHLAHSGAALSSLAGQLPSLAMIKEYIPIAPHLVYRAMQAFRDALQESDGLVTEGDGFKVQWPDAWVHVRPSNTESIIRVIAEARTESRAHELVDWARDRLPASTA
jgi:phosphomannomutase